MKEPAASRKVLEIRFHSQAAARPGSGGALSRPTRAPPPQQAPPAIAALSCSRVETESLESASMNNSHSPAAAAAPALRARPIWFTGSNTTLAPAAAAIRAVESEELLSQTITSCGSPLPAGPPKASFTLSRQAPSSFSSL